ncbi:hypothetical protein BB560_003701, partial [Smittium megazygosporum]
SSSIINPGSLLSIFAPVSLSNGVVIGKQTTVSVPDILAKLNNPNYNPPVYTNANIRQIGLTPESKHLVLVVVGGADSKTLVVILTCSHNVGIDVVLVHKEDYELIDNGICIIQNIGGEITRTCYNLDDSVTSFIDYPYEYPEDVTGMPQRTCQITREDGNNSVNCEIEEDVCVPIGPVNPCSSMNPNSPFLVTNNNLCECSSPGESEVYECKDPIVDNTSTTT